jgi:hypothetical protein
MNVVHVDKRNTRIPVPNSDSLTLNQIKDYLKSLGFNILRFRVVGDTIYFTTNSLLDIDGE